MYSQQTPGQSQQILAKSFSIFPVSADGLILEGPLEAGFQLLPGGVFAQSGESFPLSQEEHFSADIRDPSQSSSV